MKYMLPSPEKEWNFAICNQKNGTRVYYAKSDKGREILYNFTYMWNLKNRTSESKKKNRNRFIDDKTGCCEGKGGEMSETGDND